jgi:hypothetical protein
LCGGGSHRKRSSAAAMACLRCSGTHGPCGSVTASDRGRTGGCKARARRLGGEQHVWHAATASRTLARGRLALGQAAIPAWVRRTRESRATEGPTGCGGSTAESSRCRTPQNASPDAWQAALGAHPHSGAQRRHRRPVLFHLPNFEIAKLKILYTTRKSPKMKVVE